MSAGLVARRYAKALYKVTGSNLAKGKSLLGPLEAIEALFQTEEAERILRSPAMPADLKRSLLSYAMDQGNAPAEIRAFCDTIVESGRVDLMPGIINVFRELLNEAEGIVDARVHSAVPLSSSDKAAIEATIAQIVGKSVNLQTEQDPSLLGGFVVNVGNYKIDLSLKTKIEELAHEAAAAQ